MSDPYKLNVFAYYYPWYKGPADSKWATLHEYSPRLGFYDSGDEAVLRSHIEWGIEYDLSGFLVEWYGPDDSDPGDDVELPDRLNENTTLLSSLLGEHPDFRFAIFYDQAIRFGHPKNLRFLDQGRRRVFLDDLEYVARNYFASPNYLRVRGRPVVVIYLTRSASDDYASLLDEARDRMEDAGYGRPYLIGDEIWWRMKNHYFSALDAVTAFNLNNRKKMLEVSGTVREYAVAAAELVAEVQHDANAKGADVIPGIVPAYNDEFLRGNLPQITTAEPGALPEHRQDIIECMKAQAVVWENNRLFRDTSEAFIFINSFNEWPERSSVEPSAEIETVNRIWDYRTGTRLYLQPHRYEFLEGIRTGKRLIENNILPSL
jgi:hypothetical protein